MLNIWLMVDLFLLNYHWYSPINSLKCGKTLAKGIFQRISHELLYFELGQLWILSILVVSSFFQVKMSLGISSYSLITYAWIWIGLFWDLYFYLFIIIIIIIIYYYYYSYFSLSTASSTFKWLTSGMCDSEAYISYL